jgi:DNA-directed RNA polymerase subunit RPC12/RpoP
MAPCASCGNTVSRWNKVGDYCPDCARKRLKHEREELIASLGGAPIHAQWVISDVLTKPNAMNLHVGDLVVTTQGLVYFVYSWCTYTGGLGEALGFLVRGATGGIAMAIYNAQEMGNAKGNAANAREAVFGVSVEERIRSCSATVIPKGNIKRLESDSKSSVITILHTLTPKSDDRSISLALAIPNAAQVYEYLQRWLVGNVEDREDVQGANLRLPPASELLRKIASGQLDAASARDWLSRVPEIEKYNRAFCEALKKIKRPAQLDVAGKINSLSPHVAQNLAGRFHGSMRSEFRTAMIFAVLTACLLVLLVWGLAALPLDSPGDKPMFAALEGVFPASFGIGAWVYWRNYKRLRTLIRALAPTQ